MNNDFDNDKCRTDIFETGELVVTLPASKDRQRRYAES